ncbi:membrane protein [Peribacillus asahii]|uniref:Membrane protein n=1 Tax=Peribacillus asahii TaxID=228899 RepID=A0A3Q9RRH8_9BACI|nr:hypothetical protein [Peribacillus asahii]AZV45604.1 membrane protein [Peribacillus asahii]
MSGAQILELIETAKKAGLGEYLTQNPVAQGKGTGKGPGKGTGKKPGKGTGKGPGKGTGKKPGKGTGKKPGKR